MATTKLTKVINGTQLVAELKAAGHNITSPSPSQVDDQLSVEGDLTDQQLADALVGHAPDPNFGRTQDDIDIDDFLAKTSPTAADTVKAAKAMGRKLRGRK